jgi:hypothetical protein
MTRGREKEVHEETQINARWDEVADQEKAAPKGGERLR